MFGKFIKEDARWAFYFEEQDGCIEISDEEHAALFDAIHSALPMPKVIGVGPDGRPQIQDPVYDQDALESMARARRDLLLKGTDHMVMPDYPLTEAALAEVKTFRQTLRDITKQVDFPSTIEWPILKEGV